MTNPEIYILKQITSYPETIRLRLDLTCEAGPRSGGFLDKSEKGLTRGSAFGLTAPGLDSLGIPKYTAER